MRYLIITVLLVIVILFIPEFVIAQPGLPAAPSQAPIDGGLGVLAAAGGAYAWKKLKSRKED
jgi:hypothetical protein